MATARPVVVSRTAAIESGYGLVDGENCLPVRPGDDAAFERAIAGLLADQAAAEALGGRARRLVESSLTWEQYVDAMRSVLVAAVARHSAR